MDLVHRTVSQVRAMKSYAKDPYGLRGRDYRQKESDRSGLSGSKDQT